MIYKIKLSEGVGLQNEFIVATPINFDSEMGKLALHDFKNYIIRDRMDPEQAVQLAFNKRGYGVNLITIDKTIICDDL